MKAEMRHKGITNDNEEPQATPTPEMQSKLTETNSKEERSQSPTSLIQETTPATPSLNLQKTPVTPSPPRKPMNN
jgi:hypothetical protein